MRQLLPQSGDTIDVHDLYAVDWLLKGGVRVNFVASVDGAIAVDGLSKGLQTPGDNRIFAALRDLADVVLVGSGTARAEGYGPVRPDSRRAAARKLYGFRSGLPVAVVSASLSLDPESKLFAAATPDARTIVVTCASAPQERMNALREVADLIVVGGASVDLRAACTQLRERGLTRILCEGGPGLFGDLVAASVVDELCLSISPVLAGPGVGRITGSRDPWPSGVTRPTLMLAALLEEDGALFHRYRMYATD
jgi:riboflavin biosynthesis pyrimidine reductase